MTAVEKGAQYVAQGRLVVRSLNERSGVVAADCRGDGAVWHLGYEPRLGWWCSCPARSRCAHLHALGLVVAVEPREAP